MGQPRGLVNNNKPTVGMMGTITGLVRTSRRVLCVGVVCDALGRFDVMEYTVAEDDV